MRMDGAMAFFEACETGKGWTGCAPFCTPDATFAAQARALDKVQSLSGYADWMTKICERMPDAGYEIRGVGEDAARNLVLVYGVFSGTVERDGAAHMYRTDYVYSIEFKGDLIGHVTKIWNDTYG